MTDEPRRILIIHLGQLGDAVMALPAVTALKKAYPAASLSILAPPAGGALFALAGYNDVIAVDRSAWRHRPWQAIHGLPNLLLKLRRSNFDLSVDLHSYKETNLLAWLAGIPQRLAMLRPTRTWPRLLTLRPPPDDTTGRLIDRYCTVLRPLGITVNDRSPQLNPPQADWFDVAHRGMPVLGICPGAGRPERRWPADRFAAAARVIHREHGGEVAVFAGPEESEEVLAPFRNLPATRIWRGLSIAELAGALSRCRLVLTNPTGPSHIAAAVGTRVISLGEIPAFDPVSASGAVTTIRARNRVADIELEEVLLAIERGGLGWN